jgi:pyruvate-formate lyase-activating enzyme
MPRNIYMCFAIMLLAACNSNGLQSVASTNGTIAVDSKEKSACEAKGGYYSKTLGCFDQ